MVLLQSGWVANTVVSPNPFNGTMMIEIDGQNSGGANDNGLSFNTGSDGSIVRGLVINRFPQDGISLIDANNITIQGNYLGTSIDGLTDLGNEARDWVVLLVLAPTTTWWVGSILRIAISCQVIVMPEVQKAMKA